MSLVMKARNEVEKVEGGFPMLDQGWHVARFDGIGDPVESTWPIKYGPRKGDFPWRTYFKFFVPSEDMEVRSGFFDIDDPHEEIVIKLQNALAGRTVADDEEFDFGDYEGNRIEVFVVHNTRTKGANAGKTFADVTDARPRKQAKKSAPTRDDFPEDDE